MATRNGAPHESIPSDISWVPILLYHRVVPARPAHDPVRNCIDTKTFEHQLAWLAQRGYRSLPLGALNDAVPEQGSKQPSLPRRSVVITFDDGYRDNYQHAWPILRRYGFTGTIFLVSGAIGGDNEFDTGYGGIPVPMLTLGEIEEMQRHGMNFGSHTCSHPATLVDLSDSRLADELQRSRQALEGVLGVPVQHFAYPHSKLDDRIEAAVEAAGYRLACAGVGTRFSRFCLNRVEPFLRRGANLELYLRWRQLKWLVRSTQRRLAEPHRPVGPAY